MNKLIADYLPAAYPSEADCPPPESWAAVLNQELNEQAIKKLHRHADECNACSAERTLAQRFLEDSSENIEDIAWIVKKLEQAQPRRATVLSFPSRWTRYAQPVLGLAAAAMLIIAFAPMLSVFQPAISVLPNDTGTVRGSEVFVSEPSGIVRHHPARLEWIHHSTATTYQLTVFAVDGDVVWQGTTRADTTHIDLPRELLHRHVVYYWQVEALNADGQSVGQSRKTQFQISGENR